MDLILALDAGTTGVRTVAFSNRLQVIDEAHRELTQFFPSPGEVEHDAGEIAKLAIATLREVTSRQRRAGHEVVALGITNQRETTVAFDRERASILAPAIVWQDRRTAPLCASLEAQGHGALVREKTGLILDSYFSATKMKWLLDQGLVDHATAPAFATVDTWLMWVLSGGVDTGVFVTEPSNASRTSLMDLETLDWSPAMLNLFGVEHSMLARIRPSSCDFAHIAGEVIAELAGVPITGVLGDQQAALFGQACFQSGVVKATYGTGAFLLANVGEQVPAIVDGLLSTVAWDLGVFGPTTYALEGSAFVAGAAVQWLRDLKFFDEAKELEALARSVASSDGVQFVPAFSGLGSPFWRSDARGALIGLSHSTGRGEIARALVDALAYQVRAITDAFRNGGVHVRELRCDGGVAAMDLLLELQATNSRVVVRRCATLEATARGAASVAGLEVGLWHSLDELADLWSSQCDFSPNEPNVVDEGYHRWLDAIERA
ncbi:MAG: FGGY family carbohydrate kinase [Acidimicrobiales bacterium]